MALKGEAKKAYQREYMRKRREAVRPSPLEQVLDPALLDLLDNVDNTTELDLLDPPAVLDLDVRPAHHAPLPNSPDGRYH